MNNNSNSIVGVTAGIVGALAAVAVFTACRKKKQINPNEEAFLRA